MDHSYSPINNYKYTKNTYFNNNHGYETKHIVLSKNVSQNKTFFEYLIHDWSNYCYILTQLPLTCSQKDEKSILEIHKVIKLVLLSSDFF